MGGLAMVRFDPTLVELMRKALEESMTRVPLEYSTPAIKAYVAECILKAAAQGQTGYDGLVATAVEQVRNALTLVI
jgi:hypothetical protein